MVYVGAAERVGEEEAAVKLAEESRSAPRMKVSLRAASRASLDAHNMLVTHPQALAVAQVEISVLRRSWYGRRGG